MINTPTLMLFFISIFLLGGWLIERRNRRLYSKRIAQKMGNQIEQIILEISQELEPLYDDLKIRPKDFDLLHLGQHVPIGELKAKEYRLWNRHLALLKKTIMRQHQLHQYLRQMARRKEEELRAFNYTVSHDLKTPLNNALYFMDLSLLRMSDHPDPELVSYLDQTKGLLNEIRDMIDSIAAYAYADNVAMSIQTVDLLTLLQKITRQIKQSNYHYAKCEVHIEQTIPPVAADPLLIRQALTNILSNAFKFSKYQAAPLIRILAKEKEQNLELCIQDNGAGIPPEGIHKIFELFQSAHSRSAFEGSGAGLAIVKRILERHKGQIWVESGGLDRGSSFYIRIPLATNPDSA